MRSPLEQGEQSVCDFNSFKGVNGQRSNWISRNKYEHTKKIRRVPRRENTDGHPFFEPFICMDVLSPPRNLQTL